ncbi:MAG: Na+/H+ antiporter subunit E [Lachnospiraceae bacterium]|nr:Na+/H+ antiporter subunit E [Lachnospiraceae bacterium]
MKKLNPASFISVFILGFLFWMVITGQITAIFRNEASLQVIVAGLVVSAAVSLFSARFFIHEKAFHLCNPARLVNLIFYCVCIFPVELVKANVDMAFRALSPALRINPGIVRVPVDLKSEYGQAMLADSITLTPGTVTMAAVKDGEDGDRTCFYIHWINVESQEPEEAGEKIKGNMERAIRRIWE